jgi:hypothetical protein
MPTGNTTSNTSALIRSQVYSEIILDEIQGGFLPEGMHRDVSDFADGDTLYVPTFGEVVLRDIVEDKDIPIDAVDTGQISLSISEYVGAGNYLTDKVKQDSYKLREFEATLVPKHLRAIKERYETDLLATANDQTADDPNSVNNYAHRFVASGTNDTITPEDFIYAKLAMDKADVPDEGRILIVDPLVEATLNSLTNLVNVSNNPMFEGIVESGFAKNMRFIKNIFGFDIFVSNRLPSVTAESIDTTTGSNIAAPSGSATVAAGVVNQFMCVADDMVKPYMGAWREMPSTEGYRNARRKRDEFYTTARWGFGIQRSQCLVSLLTSSAHY